MLAQAHRKHPEVPSRVVALQDLAALPDRFDGLLCVDALECVAPEDWPVVTAGFASVAARSAGSLPVALTAGFRAGFAVSAALVALAAIMALTLLGDDGRGERVNLVELQAHG